MVTTTARFNVTRDVEPGVPRIENLKTTPTEVKAGESFTVSYTLLNDGAGPMSGAAVIEFDCAGGVCIPPRPIRPRTVQAKGSAPETVQFQMPENATPGAYSVRVRYDQNSSGNATAPPVRSVFAAKNTTVS